MRRRQLKDRQKQAIAMNAKNMASRAASMNPREKELYGFILDAQIRADHSLGVTAKFIPEGPHLVYQRVVNPAASPANPAIALPHFARISAYTYMLACRSLLRIHHAAMIRAGASQCDAENYLSELCTELKHIENAYHTRAGNLTSGPSAELFRQSFIRDHLAPFITQHKLLLPTKTTTIRGAIKALDTAKDYPGIMMTPYIMRTHGVIKTSGGTTLAHYIREETPFTHTSTDIKQEYHDCESKDWFTCQTPLQQCLIHHYKPQLEAGNHGTPSQTRKSLIGIKNGSTTRVHLSNAQHKKGQLLSETHHTAANSLANAKVPEAERRRITALMLNNLKEQLDTDHLTDITLLSEHGDDMLRLKDEKDGKAPGTYLDQSIVRDTRAVAQDLTGVESGNICLNAFRYGEGDDVTTIANYLIKLETPLTELANVPLRVQRTHRSNTTTFSFIIHCELADIQKQIRDIKESMDTLNARVAKADDIIAKGLKLPPLIRTIVRSRLAKDGVRQSVINNLTDQQLNRLAATKVNSKKIRRALRESVDGGVKGIELLQQCQHLILQINTLRARIQEDLIDQEKTPDADPVAAEYHRLLNAIKPTTLVTNCASGQNRTLIVDHVSAAISMTHALQHSDEDLHQRHHDDLPEYVMQAMTDDYHVPIRSGLGFTNPNFGLRNKSNDTTSTQHEKDGAVASRKFALSADWKSLDQTLVPWREWLESAHNTQVPRLFSNALNAIASELKKHTVNQKAPINPKELPPHLQKMLKSMESECSADGPLRGTDIKNHPMWPNLLAARRVHAIQTKCGSLALNAWKELTEGYKKRLTPPPIMTDAIRKRDKAMEALRSKLRFRLRDTLNAHNRIKIQTCLDYLDSANTTYKSLAFHESYHLWKIMKAPLQAIYQAWAGMSSPNDAKKNLTPLAKLLKIKETTFVVTPTAATKKSPAPHTKKRTRAAASSIPPIATTKPTPTRVSPDELMDALSAIAHEFYGDQWNPEAVDTEEKRPKTTQGQAYVGYDHVFTHHEKPISRFFDTPPHTPSGIADDSLALHGVSSDTRAYTSKHVIKMVLPQPKKEPAEACAHHLELGLQHNTIRYVNVPTGHVAGEHITKLLAMFKKSGHKSITLTGYFTDAVKKGLEEVCQEKGIAFYDRTNPTNIPTAKRARQN